MVATSSYAGEIRDAFHVLDTARYLKSLVYAVLFGNENIYIETRIRNDNASFVDHAHSLNSATKERWLIGRLESNIAELDIND